jgi:MFS family permease
MTVWGSYNIELKTKNFNFFSLINLDQKKIIGILQIGTILEYFDLMLHVHMSVLLNEVFFPPSQLGTSGVNLGILFCSTYILRPLGAIILGYIGDKIGRKPIMIISTIMMALSCVVVANLPTYNRIGVIATVILVFCRIIHSISSVGEMVGSQLYLTELMGRPLSYTAVCFIDCACCLGGIIALTVATVILNFNLGWRMVFWFGALIALVGYVFRIVLQESQVFIHAKNNFEKNKTKSEINVNLSFNKKTALAYFLMHCGYPTCFYFVYVYCGSILKDLFMYTSTQIIYHNLMLAVIELLVTIVITYFSCKVLPLKILKLRITVLSIVMLSFPFLLLNVNSPFYLLLVQILILIGFLDNGSAEAIFFIYFPVLKRFSCSCFLYALSTTIMYLVSAFGLVCLIEKFGRQGLWVVFIPVITGFWWGISYFEKLETLQPQNHKYNLN